MKGRAGVDGTIIVGFSVTAKVMPVGEVTDKLNDLGFYFVPVTWLAMPQCGPGW
jgi:hypothetical protein